MITDFKIFESINEGRPDVGDWIVCDLGDEIDYMKKYKQIEKFFSENKGFILKANFQNFDNEYKVRYYPSSEKDRKIYDSFRKQNGYENNIHGGMANVDVIDIVGPEIKYWSKNKEDLEIIIQSNKYNI